MEKNEVNEYLKFCEEHKVNPLDEGSLREFKRICKKEASSEKIKVKDAIKELLDKEIPGCLKEPFKQEVFKLIKAAQDVEKTDINEIVKAMLGILSL